MPALPPQLSDALTFLSGWPRRAGAIACLALAALSVLHPKPGGPKYLDIVVAAHPVAAGAVLSDHALGSARWPTSSAPPGTAHLVSDLVGRHTARALSAGSPVLPDDLLEPATAAALAAGQVTTTVALADTGQVAMLRAGESVDLYPATDDSELISGQSTAAGGSGQPTGRAVRILAVLPPSDPGGATVSSGRPTMVIATDRATVGHLASRAGGAFVATLIAPP